MTKRKHIPQMAIQAEWDTEPQDDDADETTIHMFGLGPDVEPTIATLDFLKDVIGVLTDEYNSALQRWRASFVQREVPADSEVKH